ncbi:MAG: enoyl-CoA hydratase [Alphaproteobacteria bacterium]|jgi:2-(1,2-epoxy-1,2-dihydrophenyl)acetyl-CoA isomerase|nr:enoyl-CoA hydratase [Alphaproteobacteria bacterium]
MTDELLETVEDGVVTLTMNRPERLNALTMTMLQSLLEAVARADAEPEIGALVLTGSGRGFCAGGDVKGMAEGSERAATLEDRIAPLRQRMEVSKLLHDTAKPTIAMLRGPVAGAGLSLALACDMRIASDTTRITTAFAKVALSGDFGGSWFLTRLVGAAKAKELYLTSPMVEAEEALSLGLVSRLVPDAELETETMALAKGLASGPRITLGYMMANLNAAETEELATVLDLEAEHHARCGMTEDHLEAAAAFVAKRQPVFKGR